MGETKTSLLRFTENTCGLRYAINHIFFLFKIQTFKMDRVVIVQGEMNLNMICLYMLKVRRRQVVGNASKDVVPFDIDIV